MRSASTQSKITGLGVVRGVGCVSVASSFGLWALGCLSRRTSNTVSPLGSLSFSFRTPPGFSSAASKRKAELHLPWNISFANDLDMEGVFPVGRCVVLDLLALDPLGALRSGLSTSTPFFSVGSLREISFWSVCY